jgi:hypothetical protein
VQVAGDHRLDKTLEPPLPSACRPCQRLRVPALHGALAKSVATDDGSGDRRDLGSEESIDEVRVGSLDLALRERPQGDDLRASCERLVDSGSREDVRGTGEQELAGRGVAIRQLFDRKEEPVGSVSAAALVVASSR